MPATSKPCVCPICRKNLKKTEYSIACSGCKSYFHPKCINVSDSEVRLNKTLKYNCNTCTATRKSGDNMEHILNGITEKMRKQMEEQTQKCLIGFRQVVDTAVESLRVEFMGALLKLREEVEDCKQQLMDVRHENSLLHEKVKVCNEQIKDAERQNSITQRRLNRADILINGLPQSIVNLRDPVVKIAQFCKVTVNAGDIQHCCYIYGGKTVLVKFNSIHLRDSIMANYFRSHNMRLKDVLDCDVQSRIYLKDHLTPAAALLVNICRTLRDRKKVHKYVLINGDVPRVRITFVDGAEIVQNIDQCRMMLSSDAIHVLHNSRNGGEVSNGNA